MRMGISFLIQDIRRFFTLIGCLPERQGTSRLTLLPANNPSLQSVCSFIFLQHTFSQITQARLHCSSSQIYFIKNTQHDPSLRPLVFRQYSPQSEIRLQIQHHLRGSASQIIRNAVSRILGMEVVLALEYPQSGSMFERL